MGTRKMGPRDGVSQNQLSEEAEEGIGILPPGGDPSASVCCKTTCNASPHFPISSPSPSHLYPLTMDWVSPRLCLEALIPKVTLMETGPL